MNGKLRNRRMKCYRIISRNTETKEYILIKYDSLLSDILINDDNIKILAVTAPKRLVNPLFLPQKLRHDKYNLKLKAVLY